MKNFFWKYFLRNFSKSFCVFLCLESLLSRCQSSPDGSARVNFWYVIEKMKLYNIGKCQVDLVVALDVRSFQSESIWWKTSFENIFLRNFSKSFCVDESLLSRCQSSPDGFASVSFWYVIEKMILYNIGKCQVDLVVALDVRPFQSGSSWSILENILEIFSVNQLAVYV